MEFKLYRTKLKLSSLLTSSTTQPVSYLVLAAPNKDSIWFNRTNGDVSWQKSKLIFVLVVFAKLIVFFLVGLKFHELETDSNMLKN
jgi:hypothetical protein